MPPRPALPTPASIRAEAVRVRLAAVVRKLPNGEGVVKTRYGIFAKRAAQVAKESGLSWYKSNDNKAATTALRLFVEHDNHPWSKFYDVIDRTCALYEEEWREERKAAKLALAEHVEPEQPVVATPLITVHGLEFVTSLGEVATLPNLNTVVRDTEDAEITALSAMLKIIEPLQPDTRDRVVNYICDRYDIVQG